MKKASLWILLSVCVAAFLLMPATDVEASKGIAEKEDLLCTSCHDKPGSKLLTDKGKFYELTGSLEDYDKIASAFERCTHCHSRKPGSEKLTKAGKSFRKGIGDMEGLRKWLRTCPPEELEAAKASAATGAKAP